VEPRENIKDEIQEEHAKEDEHMGEGEMEKE
jgi:hypothetical protein